MHTSMGSMISSCRGRRTRLQARTLPRVSCSSSTDLRI
uniref:Uncharacterized protein n=1 Tax=Arundo donax TaxID=35708 RepID=A0A0A8ZES7_ARUDO